MLTSWLMVKVQTCDRPLDTHTEGQQGSGLDVLALIQHLSATPERMTAHQQNQVKI